jgi:hypothetical protein
MDAGGEEARSKDPPPRCTKAGQVERRLPTCATDPPPPLPCQSMGLLPKFFSPHMTALTSEPRLPSKPRGRSARDVQRTRVYASDLTLRQWTRGKGLRLNLRSVRVIERYAQTVHAWAVSTGVTTVKEMPSVRENTRSRHSTADTSRWCLTFGSKGTSRRSHFNRLTVLHELAHLYSPGDRHGAKFCAAYVLLVRQFVGEEAANMLTGDFECRGIIRRT